MPSVLANSSDGMRARRTPRFDRDLAAAPPAIQRAFEKNLAFLLRDRRHPSLQAKKYDEARGLWQARVTDTPGPLEKAHGIGFD